MSQPTHENTHENIDVSDPAADAGIFLSRIILILATLTNRKRRPSVPTSFGAESRIEGNF